MLTYATLAELTTHLGEAPPANAEALLRRASILAGEASAGAVYAVDTEGYPLDGSVRIALRDAVCAAVEEWILSGITPGTLGGESSRRVASKSLGAASVSYEASAAAQAEAEKLAAGRHLPDVGLTILRNAGLVTTRVWSY